MYWGVQAGGRRTRMQTNKHINVLSINIICIARVWLFPCRYIQAYTLYSERKGKEVFFY